MFSKTPTWLHKTFIGNTSSRTSRRIICGVKFGTERWWAIFWSDTTNRKILYTFPRTTESTKTTTLFNLPIQWYTNHFRKLHLFRYSSVRRRFVCVCTANPFRRRWKCLRTYGWIKPLLALARFSNSIGHLSFAYAVQFSLNQIYGKMINENCASAGQPCTWSQHVMFGWCAKKKSKTIEEYTFPPNNFRRKATERVKK